MASLSPAPELPLSPSSTICAPNIFVSTVPTQIPDGDENDLSVETQLRDLGYTDSMQEAMLEEHNFTRVRIRRECDFLRALLECTKNNLPQSGQSLEDCGEFFSKWRSDNEAREMAHERRMYGLKSRLMKYSRTSTDAETSCDSLWKLSEATFASLDAMSAPDTARASIDRSVRPPSDAKSGVRPSKVRKEPLRRSSRLQERAKDLMRTKAAKAPGKSKTSRKPSRSKK